jgi:hypothetical protein
MGRRRKNGNNFKQSNNKKNMTNGQGYGRPAGVGKSAMFSGSAIGKLAQSVVDPWSTSSCVPDGATGAGCFTTKETFNLSTGATGSVMAVCCNGDPRNNFTAQTGALGATWTFAAATLWNPATSIAALAAIYRSYRLVSMGLRVSYIGTTTNDAGSVIGAVYADGMVPFLLDGGSLATAISLAMDYSTGAIRNGMSVVWRPQSYDDIGAWTLIGNSPSLALGAPGEAPLTKPWLFIGANSAAINGGGALLVEMVCNYEGMYRLGTFYAGGISRQLAAPAIDGWYEKLQNAVRKVSPITAFVMRSLTGINRPLIEYRKGPTVEELD